MILTVTDLTIARGGVPVLEALGFVLAPGRALVLRGPNGIGKTTLLRTVAGLQPAIAGRIEGADETIAYAGHSDGIKPTLSVAENLRFWAAVFGAGSIRPALDAYDLGDLADRHAGGRVVSALEGGYNLDALAASTAAHIKVLMERSA